MKKLTYLFIVSILVLFSCKKDSVSIVDAQAFKPNAPINIEAFEREENSFKVRWEYDGSAENIVSYSVYVNEIFLASVNEMEYLVTNLVSGNTYSVSVTAIGINDVASEKSAAISVTTVASTDNEAPSIPTGLSSSNITEVSADISWNAATDNVAVTSYGVYQNNVSVGQIAKTSYSATNLVSNTSYSFTISALDAAGNESVKSSPFTFKTSASTTKLKVLVFTKTAGFNHNTSAESVSMVQQIATNQNFDVVVDNSGTAFNSLANLNQFAVIFFNNTSGNTLTPAQRVNVESYAAQGGNFIANHAASDSYGHSTSSTVSGNGKGEWDWYAENVTGCSVRNNPNHTSSGFAATVTIVTQNTSYTTSISFPWSDSEEWYYWEGGYLNNSFTELLRVSDTGANSYDDPRMTAQFRVRPDGGKSFYTSMGHAKTKYADSNFIQLLSNMFASML